MKNFIIITICFLFISHYSFGQGAVFNWAQNYTTQIDNIELDSLSNIYSIGGGSITKRTPSGTLLWTRTITTIQSLAVTPNGDVYITGGFTGTVNFNGWGAGYPLTSAGNKDIFVSKLNTNGDFVWAQRIGDVGSDSATQISLDTLGHVYITGGFNGSVDFDPGPQSTVYSNGNSFILKLDTAGYFIWARELNIQQYGFGQNGISLSRVSKGGYLYIVGRGSNSDLDPGPGIYQSNASADFMLKLNPSGMFVTAYIGSPFMAAPRYLNGIRIDGNNNVYYTASDVTFGNLHNAYIIKHDGSCNYINAVNFYNMGTGNDLQIKAIDIDAQNNIYVAGEFESNATFVNQYVTTTERAGFIVRINALTSSLDWIRKISGNVNDYNSTAIGLDVAVSNSGCVYNSGVINGNVNFNTINSPFYLSSATGSTYLHSVCNCSVYSNTMTMLVCDSTTISGITYNSSGQYNQVINNPNGCDTNLTINLTVHYSQFDTTYATSCINYTFNGITYNTSGVFYQYYVAANLCDSIKVLYLDVLQPSSSTIIQTSDCTYSLNGQTYSTSGLHTQTFTNAVGCDSVVYLYLTITNPLVATVSQSGNTLTVQNTNVGCQWVDCNNNFASIPGETNLYFTPTINGSYAVIINSPSCIDTSNCFVFNSVGITEVKSNGLIQFYPNPTTSHIAIQSATPLTDATIRIYDMTGALLQEKVNLNGSKFQLNLFSYANGLYQIELINQGVRYRSKVMKE